LAQRFGQLGAWLLEQEFAHGDLKHDNIMVRPDGSLLLIDYDGMFVPALQGRQALELGGQGYQHPARTAQHFNRHLDDFSILIISLSLHALAAAPELYYEKTTDNLLLAQTDLQNLQTSAILNRLFVLNHPEVNRLMMLLFQSLAAQSLHIPQLPALLPKAEITYSKLIPYLKGGLYGFCTPDKKIVVPCVYDWAEPFREGLAWVNTGSTHYGYDGFIGGKWGFINTSGQEVVPCVYDGAGAFREGLARVKKNEKYGFINKNGQEVVPCVYDGAGDFREGLARVKKNEKYGFINKNGQEVVPCVYDGA
ncbi:MAG: WG repeat-containing protein, partial [Bernardetiaceae bacterium]|nr:WG repeat-containing protein [Bernardetiaceae bacterium]